MKCGKPFCACMGTCFAMHSPLKDAAPVQQEPNNCAQCKKEYRKGSCVGCPKCAKGVDVAESEFQKPVQQGNQFNPDWDQQAVLVERVRELEEALKQARSDALEEAVEYALDACDSWARNNWQLKDAIRALGAK